MMWTHTLLLKFNPWMTGSGRKKFVDEAELLSKQISNLIKLLSSKKLIFQLIEKESIELRHKFGSLRHSFIEYSGSSQLEEIEEMLLTLSEKGYLKRMKPNTNTFSLQLKSVFEHLGEDKRCDFNEIKRRQNGFNGWCDFNEIKRRQNGFNGCHTCGYTEKLAEIIRVLTADCFVLHVELYDTTIRLGQLQAQFKLAIDPMEYARDNLKFGLVEVVYEWQREPHLLIFVSSLTYLKAS